jgi:hypothetical protein
VFTYIAQKTREGRVRGKRYPITASGFKTAWRRPRAKAGLADGINPLRNHDLRDMTLPPNFCAATAI